MSLRALRSWVALVVGLVAFAAFAGNPPPPYTAAQVNLSTVNALGGVGRTEGFIKAAVTTPGRDFFVQGAWPSDISAEMTSLKVVPLIRTYTVKIVGTLATSGAVCARLGPSTNGGPPPGNPDGAPALSCPDTNASTASTGGCYLVATGESCVITVRPKTSGCTDYDSCHQPLWIISSSSAGSVNVAVSQAW